MNTNGNTKLLLKAEVFQIVGAAIEVLNGLGHGFYEKSYENALIVEFGFRNIPYKQQPSFAMVYQGQQVGQFIPDLIAFDAIVVSAKVIDRIIDIERGQIINYLKITNLRVGIILNFKHPRLDWEVRISVFERAIGRRSG